MDMFKCAVEQLPLIWEELTPPDLVRQCVWQIAAHRENCGGSMVPLRRTAGQRGPGGGAGEPLQRPAGATRSSSACRAAPANAPGQNRDIGVGCHQKKAGTSTSAATAAWPRHAELFASDLSKQDLVRMIDRVDVYAHRDRLQRTSTWRENLEGAWTTSRTCSKRQPGPVPELESQMQQVVNNLPVRMETAAD